MKVIVVCLIWVVRGEDYIGGKWGAWTEKSRCHNCLGVRYQYNCSNKDPRSIAKSWNSNGICSQGIYYERMNRVLNNCFIQEGSSEDDHGIAQINSSDAYSAERKIKELGLWETGQGPWTRCSRRAGRPKGNIYNRRGRKARAYYCPTDNWTIWKEQWRYCCAGAWSTWTEITPCPKCGRGLKRSVRICGTPGVLYDVASLSLDGEFMTEWKSEACGNSPCPRVKKKRVPCVVVCRQESWDDKTQCTIDNKVVNAKQCCTKQDVEASCRASVAISSRKTVMVAVILGAEGLLIAFTAVIITLYNIGRVPHIITRVVGAGLCVKSNEQDLAPTARREVGKQAPIKRRRVVQMNRKEAKKYLEKLKRPAIETISVSDIKIQ